MKVQETVNEIIVTTSHLKLRLVKKNDVIVEEYYLKDDDEWKLLVMSDRDDLNIDEMKDHSTIIFRGNNEELEANFTNMKVQDQSDKSVMIACTGIISGCPIIQEIQVNEDEKTFHFKVRLQARSRIHLNGYLKKLACVNPVNASEQWDFVFIPNLRPKKNDIIGDHVFRSPLIALQKANFRIALIPDLNHLKKNRIMKTCLDFERAG
ncbi:MAG: hypothetical protein ACXQS8_04355, partial [Candidatus Helarchaeales archaeon]